MDGGSRRTCCVCLHTHTHTMLFAVRGTLLYRWCHLFLFHLQIPGEMLNQVRLLSETGVSNKKSVGIKRNVFSRRHKEIPTHSKTAQAFEVCVCVRACVCACVCVCKHTCVVTYFLPSSFMLADGEGHHSRACSLFHASYHGGWIIL